MANRTKLTQEESLKRVEEILAGTPYKVVRPFVYEGDRKTNIKLHCTLHDETWEMSCIVSCTTITAVKVMTDVVDVDKHIRKNNVKKLLYCVQQEVNLKRNILGNTIKLCGWDGLSRYVLI